MMRIGFGYDVHRLVEGRQLIIGGVNIPWKLGLLGHSDADILVHAVMDSILGALGRGDIGRHFPDTDPVNKDRDSFHMLREVMSMVKQDMFSVNNIDITVVAQEPRLSPYVDKMEENLSTALDVDINKVNIKATTTEGLGFAGREEGMEAYAVVSLVKKKV
jgi:2-C-methyl-D-erythritol 2,4-cyclodiphosphate synthase